MWLGDRRRRWRFVLTPAACRHPDWTDRPLFCLWYDVMPRFSAGLHSDSESHAEMQRTNSFILIFHNFSNKKWNFEIKINIYKTYLACKNTLKLTYGNLRFRKIFRGANPRTPAPLGRSRLTWPGRETSNAEGGEWKGKGRELGKGKGRGGSLGSRLTLVPGAYETLNPSLPVFKLE
jgi:hypothetical protein